MKRRSAVKSLMIIAGGIAIMPSCSNDPGKASIELKKINITADQEALLSEIAETIISVKDIPGAKNLNLHLFTMKMVDDCHNEEEQKVFIIGLNNVDKAAETKYGNSFAKCDARQRTALLTAISKEEEALKDIAPFLKIAKRRIIQGFMNSKYVMTDLKKYELVPGRYNGYFPVKQA
ncbi:MAG: gluconate 2-dehydrogenase subunit 3 family protein [Chitinophagaceae bacterium]|nr:gluconate 2-dehydrogenase subunit 3 family protein [Chitinophagaceae bacterium]